MINRRSFIKSSGLATMGLLACSSQSLAKQQFKISLNPGNIGVQVSQKDLLDLAHQNGFQAITANATEIAQWSKEEQQSYQAQMKAKGLSWDVAGLPVQFRQTAALFEEQLAALPSLAAALQNVGVKGLNTWVMPTHPNLSYIENFKQHATRLRAIGKVLKDYNLRLGLEYVAPKTLMASDRYPFLHTMKETQDLIAEIGTGNIGLILDSFHWYCAEETTEDIAGLSKEEIISVDLNDAKAGRSPAEQLDGERELPGQSGVINLTSFLTALQKTGYRGCVKAEPFNQQLNEMEDAAAVKATMAAMRKVIG